MGLDDLRSTNLFLGLGLIPSPTLELNSNKPRKIPEPCLTLSLSGETYDLVKKVDYSDVVVNDKADLYRQDSAASSFSNVSVKREREICSEEGELELERVSSRASDEDDDGVNGRKKLRLTKAQSALLEESFKQHSTLNPVIILILILCSNLSDFVNRRG